MLFYKSYNLNSYNIITDEEDTSLTAKRVLIKYIELSCGKYEGSLNNTIYVLTDKTIQKDYFKIYSQGYNIFLTGSKRGVIYSVYEFLEKYYGFGFYAYDLDFIPQEDINYCQDVYNEQQSVIDFREILGNSASGDDVENLLKFRLNSNFWSQKLNSALGGGYSFAGIPAHSLTGQFLLNDYVDKDDNMIFSLVNGKRLSDEKGQVCFSYPNLINIITLEVEKLIEKNPNATYVSISQGDNGNFCQCEKCKKLYQNNTVSDLFFGIVNHVAKNIKKKYSNILIHTIAYNQTMLPPNFELEDNVIVQYCIGKCKNHSLSDTNCEINEVGIHEFERWAKISKNLLIWDYPNCFKHQLFVLPIIKFLRVNYQYFAKYNVKGVFNEYNHRKGDGFCQFTELKTFLLSKLMWNPYISEEQFELYFTNFMQKYYGKSAIYLMEYIKIYENAFSSSIHFDYDICDLKSKDYLLNKNIFDKNKIESLLSTGNKLWKNALNSAENSKIFSKVEREYIQFLYLKQIVKFDDVLKNSEEEKRLLDDNKTLIDLIIKYNIKLTFWGQSVENQNAELRNCYQISPIHWNYKW